MPIIECQILYEYNSEKMANPLVNTIIYMVLPEKSHVIVIV